jgi:hypothetical protein
MSGSALKRLLREWAALLAVLALALGPLALATSRSLGAAEKIATASGMKPLALCLPGGLSGEQAHDADCGHCTPAQAFCLAGPAVVQGVALSASSASVAPSQVLISGFPRAPPARGPPSA